MATNIQSEFTIILEKDTRDVWVDGKKVETTVSITFLIFNKL